MFASVCASGTGVLLLGDRVLRDCLAGRSFELHLAEGLEFRHFLGRDAGNRDEHLLRPGPVVWAFRVVVLGVQTEPVEPRRHLLVHDLLRKHAAPKKERSAMKRHA